MDKNTLFALIVAMGLFFFMKKDPSEKAQQENSEVKQKVKEIEEAATKVQSSLEQEVNKRSELTKEMREKANEALTPEEIADFFNRDK